MRLILIIVFGLIFTVAKANLPITSLSLELSSAEKTYSADDIMHFNLKFTNTDKAKSYAVLLPGNMPQGRKIVFISFFKVKNNFYTEVARDSALIKMPVDAGSNIITNVRPGQSTSIPIFFNDKENFNKHIEAQHSIPNLPEGEYEVIAWYVPWSDALAKHIYQYKNKYDHNKTFEEGKLLLPEEGLVSNYTHIRIIKNKLKKAAFSPTKFCPANCCFCAAIETENWEKAAQIIDKQTYNDGKSVSKNSDSAWRMPHRTVSWLSEGPSEILASLPTYTYRQFIFKTAEGYRYVYARWQLGIIYSGRSRLHAMGYYVFRRNLKITTSNIDYCKLVSFKPW